MMHTIIFFVFAGPIEHVFRFPKISSLHLFSNMETSFIEKRKKYKSFDLFSIFLTCRAYCHFTTVDECFYQDHLLPFILGL